MLYLIKNAQGYTKIVVQADGSNESRAKIEKIVADNHPGEGFSRCLDQDALIKTFIEAGFGCHGYREVDTGTAIL